jgi:trigger factor
VEAGTCKKELVIEIPAEVVQQEANSVTTQYARVARIPGFRPGHAPATLVRRHFREDIRSEVVQTLLPRFFENAVKDQKWSVVGRPRFEDLKFEDDQPLTCKATFEIIPEFELKEYKGLEVEEAEPTVTDADIEQRLEEFRERAATFEVVSDRPATDDDYLTVTYRGQDVNEPASQPVEAKDVVVHLGGQGTVVAFTEKLRGVKSGEARQFQVIYPQDYPQKSLAGKTFDYHVEVSSIKKKVVPPVDDELAKSVSEFSTLEELRAQLREELLERARHRTEMESKQKLLDALLAAHEFPVPDILVEVQLDRRLERTVTQLLAQGVDPRAMEVDWRQVRQEGRPEAEKEVRASLLLGRVAEAEKIEVTEEAVDEMIRHMAQERHETPAALKTRLTRDGELDRIKSTRRNQEALNLIYRNAKIIRKSE